MAREPATIAGMERIAASIGLMLLTASFAGFVLRRSDIFSYGAAAFCLLVSIALTIVAVIWLCKSAADFGKKPRRIGEPLRSRYPSRP